MPKVYFLKHDGMCDFMKIELSKWFPKYIQENENENEIKYYFVLDWNSKSRGHISEMFEANNFRYIDKIEKFDDGNVLVNFNQKIRKLGKNEGIYVAAYDGNIKQLKKLEEYNIPIIYRECPWLKKLKNELINCEDKYLYILLLKEGHIVHRNYNSIFPKNSLLVDIINYKEKIDCYLNSNKNILPIYFIPYPTMREKDADEIINYIKLKMHNEKNIFNKKTLCGWIIKQRVLEEISWAVKEKKLDEVWVITNNEKDTSSRSIINQIEDVNAKPIAVKSIEDIPQNINKDLRFGVLIAPVPFYKSLSIKLSIRRKYPDIIN